MGDWYALHEVTILYIFCLPVDFSPSKIPPTKVSLLFSWLWRQYSIIITGDFPLHRSILCTRISPSATGQITCTQ